MNETRENRANIAGVLSFDEARRVTRAHDPRLLRSAAAGGMVYARSLRGLVLSISLGNA